MLCRSCKREKQYKRLRELQIGYSKYVVYYTVCVCFISYDKVAHLLDIYDETQKEIDALDMFDSMWMQTLKDLTKKQRLTLETLKTTGRLEKILDK